MDGEKFDALLKRMCTTRLTRLDALRGLVAGAAAAVTGASLGSEDAEARKKKGSAKRGGVKAQGKKKKKGQPTNPGGNITCAGGLKVDSGQFQAGKCGNVKHSSSGCACTIRWCVSADGKTLSFGPAQGEVSCLVGRVIVKGGPASEDYTFNPPVSSADGLISPELDNGNIPEISHFTFCDITCPPCKPADCPKKPCQEAYCDANGKCAYRPIVCPPRDDKCEEAYCDPDKGSCKTRPIVCPPSNNKCEEVYCDPQKGCKTRPVACEPRHKCETATCDPEKGCTYTPIVCNDNDPCTTDTCDPQTGCVYTDIVCRPETKCEKNCVCVPKKDGTHTCTCEPVVCSPENKCQKNCVCDPYDGSCTCEPVVCEPRNKCETARCDPDRGCVYTPIVCDDGDPCTIDSCDPDKGCKTRPVICEPENTCQKNCICVPKKDGGHECKCERVVCNDNNPCTTDTCDPDYGCRHTPVVCEPENSCQKNCVCDPYDNGKCKCQPVVCEPRNKCETAICEPDKGCKYTPITCPPRPGCDGICDPVKGCVYTCICSGDESPKGCPNPGDNPKYTCKRCPGVTQGSLQVACNGTTPKCVCNSNTCTINGQTVPSGANVTGVCPPVRCDTGLQA